MVLPLALWLKRTHDGWSSRNLEWYLNQNRTGHYARLVFWILCYFSCPWKSPVTLFLSLHNCLISLTLNISPWYFSTSKGNREKELENWFSKKYANCGDWGTGQWRNYYITQEFSRGAGWRHREVVVCYAWNKTYLHQYSKPQCKKL